MKRGLAAGALTLLLGCEGVSTSPEQYADREPPSAVLSEGEHQRLLVLVEQAVSAADRDRFESAEESARRALDLDPRSARARAVLGRCLLHRAQLSEPTDRGLENAADGETLLALRLAPADPVVARFRAAFLAGVGHRSAAATAAESALEQLPERSLPEVLDLVEVAARHRYELGEERKALEHLLVLAEHRPGDAVTWYRLGVCRLRIASSTLDATLARKLRDTDAAAAAFAQAARLEGGDLEAWLAVGEAFVQGAAHARDENDAAASQERLQSAAKAYTEAAMQFPASPEARFGSAVVMEASGNLPAARQAYEDLLEAHPDHMGALLNLGALLAAQEDPAARSRSAALLRRALALGDGDEDALTPAERKRIEEFLAGR